MDRDRIDSIIQTAAIGPAISQKLIVLLVIAVLLVAVLFPHHPEKPDIPLPVCEAGQECVTYEIEP
jgi:hypothetical protein